MAKVEYKTALPTGILQTKKADVLLQDLGPDAVCIALLSRIDGGRLEVSCRRIEAVKHACFSGFLAATRLILPSCSVGQGS